MILPGGQVQLESNVVAGEEIENEPGHGRHGWLPVNSLKKFAGHAEQFPPGSPTYLHTQNNET